MASGARATSDVFHRGRLGLTAWLLTAVMSLSAAAESPSPSKSDASDKVARLIRQLGDADYQVRQRAQAELEKFGFEAFDAISDATTDDDLEIAARAKYLLRRIRVEWTQESDPPEVKRCLKGYEFRDPGAWMAKIRDLGGLPENQGLPALCRLVRFETSPALSKYAAIQILSHSKPGEPPSASVVAGIRRWLAGSRRPAVGWLMVYARFAEEVEPALKDWAALAEAEVALMRRAPRETSRDVVSSLLRFQINWLETLKRNDQAIAVMGRLIDLEEGSPETLQDIVDWLINQKAWRLIDEVAARFSVRFATQPGLLYMLAESQLLQGNQEKAQEFVDKARKLSPGKSPTELLVHALAAQYLAQRGRFEWAEHEFREVIARGPAGDDITIRAQFGFSEMLHDQGRDLPAAEVLQDVVKATGKFRFGNVELGGRSLGEVKSRMHYFFACHWLAQGDKDKYRQALDSALAADPNDVDVLIACYRLADATPDYRKKIREMIRKSADEYREQINENPEDPTPYNQFAWLIGNTEGDFDEALRFSKTSLELKPNTGGFYDTMARVYYGKGDYENAIKAQTKAHELDPHSGLIARQLDLFRKTWEEKKKEAPGPPQAPAGTEQP